MLAVRNKSRQKFNGDGKKGRQIETTPKQHCPNVIVKNQFFVLSKSDFVFWYMVKSDFSEI